MPDSDSTAVFRILDASANRVAEGLRTIEEGVRFGNNDARSTRELKEIRHSIAQALSVIPRSRLLAARDTVGDVGTTLETNDEYERKSSVDVIVAAISRTSQSLRVIEEYLKTIDGLAARKVEQARYRFYTVSAEIELLARGTDRRALLAKAKLYVLVDCRSSEADFCRWIELLATAGVDVFQLRDDRQDDRTLIARAQRGCEISKPHGALFIMNDRADLAFASQCDGVHLGQEELPIEMAHQIIGQDRLVGCSTHNLAQAKEAVAQGADYLGCGPVFPSQTKSFGTFPGIAYLGEVTRQIDLPCFAIGGIDTSNLEEVIGAGFHRVAVTGAVTRAEDPAAMVTRLKSRLVMESTLQKNPLDLR